ncbi:NAD(P)-binding protein [Bimuria novae-zelandiae CBS 107.79]|uniref:NAD(P)-binding protein n=1 Tax=Bimuria novae-zelandiae CBS 107.79 TaxID=1447943 RepID=A0A6A5UV87_9PLEO|nr:NAD(P)-binding protein [Bimuria novae-zelandiae CBS 107.79]
MPVHILSQLWEQGFSSVPYGWTLLKLLPVIAVVYLLKLYFNGAVNTSERNMHSKVVMMTGGTSGIGAEVAKGLASRGAQLVLLTQHTLTDPFLVDYIEDLRSQTGNELITAERVDLESLHSIREFATKWIDNLPPRRLDMIILCANTRTPPGGEATFTEDGLESTWGLNYLANFHLLSILSPALRAQPPDRDVRIIFGTCSSYIGGVLPVSTDSSTADSKKGKKEKKEKKEEAVPFTPGSAYSTSKLALMTFALAFQKHLSSFTRADKNPVNSRVILVDPGWTRTPGMRRFLTFGSLWGLLVYMATWPLWWLFLKSADQGAQTFLYAAMEAQYGRGEGGWFLKECRQMGILKDEVKDEGVQKKLWELSEEGIKLLEQESAKRRAAEKNKGEKAGAKGKGKEAGAKTSATKENGAAKQRKGK